jgi:phosphoribosylformylglycinamidine cyclo-ligase
VGAGDVIIGLASSGPHSNGYSLIRKLIEMSGLGLADAAPFARGQSLGEALLTPTRIYVKPVLAAFKVSAGIKALAHITGGGFIENIPRVLPKQTVAEIDLAKVPCPPVFGWLQRLGGMAEREMLRTFNCGIGMIVVVAADETEAVTQSLEVSGEAVIALGRIRARSGDEEQVATRGSLALA